MKKPLFLIALVSLCAVTLSSCGLFEDELHRLDREVHELYAAQDYAAAVIAAEKALALAEKRFAAKRPKELIVPLNNLAGLYRLTGRTPEAAEIYKRMLGIFEARGAAAADMAFTNHDLAAVSLELGDMESAEKYEKISWEHRQQWILQDGLPETELAPPLNNLGYVYLMAKKYSEAEPFLLRAVKIIEKNAEPGDINLEITRSHLAELYRREKRYEDAGAIQKKIIDARITRDGPASVEAARGWNNLGVIYKESGRLNDAEPAFEEAYTILNADPSKYAADLDIVRKNYAEALALNGKTAESDSLLKK